MFVFPVEEDRQVIKLFTDITGLENVVNTISLNKSHEYKCANGQLTNL